MDWTSRTNSTRPGKLHRTRGINKDWTSPRLWEGWARTGQGQGKSDSGQGKWTRTGQVPRCWERGLDKNWTSRAGQPGVGRTLDKLLQTPPPLGIAPRKS
eukprot:gene4407-biopygen12966